VVEFPERLKQSVAKTYAEWKEAETLAEEERKGKFRRAVRVTARYLPELRKEVRSGDLVWHSDAGKQVGGKGEHPGALQHFIAGLPLCQMTHYAERASARGIKVEDLEVTAVGHYTGIAGYGFDSVEYEVRISSPESPEKVKELATAAAGDCYVTNTLKKACKVSGRLILNGNEVLGL